MWKCRGRSRINQVKLVPAVAPGAVVPVAKAWVFCIHRAKTGCNCIGYEKTYVEGALKHS